MWKVFYFCLVYPPEVMRDIIGVNFGSDDLFSRGHRIEVSWWGNSLVRGDRGVLVLDRYWQGQFPTERI
jgi:hypothetical protein